MNVLLLAALLPLAICANSGVIYLDSGSNGYIATAPNVRTPLTSEGVGATMHALLSAEPSFQVSPSASQQVHAVVTPDVFNRPDAMLALQVAGLDLDTELENFASGLGHAVAHRFSEVSQRLINAVATVRKSGSVTHMPLDTRGLPACDDACVEAMLLELAPSMGANYSADAAEPLRGVLSLPLAAGGAAVLDLSQLPARLWAVEVTTLAKMSADAAAAAAAADSNAPRVPALLEATLVGLQGLANTYGADAPETRAAAKATLQVIGGAVQRLGDAYGGRLVAQLSALGAVPLDGLQELLGWRDEQARRTLLVRSLDEEGGGSGDAVEWMTLAAQVLVAVLLLVATLGAIYSLAYAKIQQDSLLFAKPKAD